jgi:hypothetical protein
MIFKTIKVLFVSILFFSCNNESKPTTEKSSDANSKPENISIDSLYGKYQSKKETSTFDLLEIRDGNKCILYNGPLKLVSDYQRTGKYIYVKYKLLEIEGQISFEILDNKNLKSELENSIFIKQ